MLHDVDLEIGGGEVRALLGENGSGKSTLIKVLSGFHLPDPGGRVSVEGSPLTVGSPTESSEAGLRFVHQKQSVILEMNALENLALETGYSRPAFIDWKAQRRQAVELLGRLGVEMDLTVPMSECRPVDRSAVAIARALRPSRDPVKLIVLDEPTASLPDPEVRQLFEVIRGLVRQGVAVMYVSHRLEEVFEIADQVTVLRDGRVQGTRPIGELSRSSLVEMILGKGLATRRREARPRRSDAGGKLVLEVSGLRAGRLQGIDLTVGAGEVVGITGLAGSGYDEVARGLVGGIPGQSGSVRVAGRPVVPLTPAVAQNAGLTLALSNTRSASAVPQFSIRENVTLSSLGEISRAGWVPRRREEEVAGEWIESLDVRPREPQRLYSELSGGNQQKVILARSLSAAPKVLVLDDPTAGVDVGSRRAIYELIGREVGRGTAVVICSSDQEDIVEVCDSALVMRGGQVVARLDGEDLSERTLLLAATGAEEEADD